jgi:outer membrane protein
MKKTILITLLTFTLSVSAQEVAPLTLKDAITFALENKADAKKAKLEVENSEYQIQEVRSRALPQISANGSLTYNPILQTVLLMGDFFWCTRNNNSSSFWTKMEFWSWSFFKSSFV